MGDSFYTMLNSTATFWLLAVAVVVIAIALLTRDERYDDEWGEP